MIAASPIDGFPSLSIMLIDLGSDMAGTWGNMPIALLPDDFFLSRFSYSSDCSRVF